MKPGPANSKQRSRGRGNGKNRMMPNRGPSMDGGGSDVRVRGNAHQVLEKYLALARDASSQGDRIAAENYYQHAEHYFRVINSANGNRPPRHHMPSPADDQAMPADEAEGGDGQDAPGDQATAGA